MALDCLGCHGLFRLTAAGAGTACRFRYSGNALDRLAAKWRATSSGESTADCSGGSLRSASSGSMDYSELADVSCCPAACSAIGDRSRRADSRRFSALVPVLGHRFRFNGRGLLELRQRTHLDRRSACPRLRFRGPVQPDGSGSGPVQPKVQRHAGARGTLRSARKRADSR